LLVRMPRAVLTLEKEKKGEGGGLSDFMCHRHKLGTFHGVGKKKSVALRPPQKVGTLTTTGEEKKGKREGAYQR